MKRKWIYILNPMERATRGNFKKALSVGNYHRAQLTSAAALDPSLTAMSTRFTVLQTDFFTKYSGWIRANNVHEGETFTFTTKLDKLTGELIPAWDIAVQKEYLEGTREYKFIFANGRSAFRQGTYEQRLANLDAFHNELRTYPALEDLADEVGVFKGELSAMRQAQLGAEQAAAKASDDLEKSRIALCRGMYANVGLLMDKYADNPVEIERFFDLSLLRSTTKVNGTVPEPEPLTGEVKSQETAVVVEGGFDVNTLFHIINTGGTSLKFYTAKLPTDPLPGSEIEVLPGQQVDAYASELGADSNLFLMCFNPDLNLTGEYSILTGDENDE